MYLVIQKAVSEKIIDPNFEEIVSNKKIINLDAEVSAEKIIIVLVIEIDGNNIYMEKAWIKQNITIVP